MTALTNHVEIGNHAQRVNKIKIFKTTLAVLANLKILVFKTFSYCLIGGINQ